ncbi:MAG: crotonase [Gammaproteobacteria bacterium]|nr:crotonase [Gammaproteobacteria bacterium]
MSEQDILFEKKDGVALVTLNRPNVLNAFRTTMFTRMLAILADVAADEQIRVMVITGNGRAFSAGIDLQEQSQFSESEISLKEARRILLETQELTRQMAQLPKPIIASLNGLAVGVGAEIAIASDIRLASDNAYFMFAEAKRALFQTNGVLYFLPRLIGYGRALEMMMTGDKYDAQSALNAGLVTHVLPVNELKDFTMSMAQRIAANAPMTLRMLKVGLQRSHQQDLESVMAYETACMMDCFVSEDYKEGILSFIERRDPVYSGR